MFFLEVGAVLGAFAGELGVPFLLEHVIPRSSCALVTCWVAISMLVGVPVAWVTLKTRRGWLTFLLGIIAGLIAGLAGIALGIAAVHLCYWLWPTPWGDFRDYVKLRVFSWTMVGAATAVCLTLFLSYCHRPQRR
jgi:uncharacterized membrane protein YfcA